VNPLLIPLIAALRALDDKLQRDASVLLLLSTDEVAERVADSDAVVAECRSSMRMMCQPLSHSDTEVLHRVLLHLRGTLKVYQHVLRAAQRCCCARLGRIDPGVPQAAWKG
jgi:hypothetical protein